MASWAALNVVGGNDQDRLAQEHATEEAQDADNAAVYERALRFQQKQKTTQAKTLYLQLLGGQIHLSPRLEYLCNKNLATMEQEAQSFENALQYYAAALALDATDVVVWFQMATAALETGKLWLARTTLEEGLRVDATYWPLVETLVQVLSQIGDEKEYQRVACYLRQNDPHCATLKALDKKRARPSTVQDLNALNRAKKKLHHLKNIADFEVQKRKRLQEEMNDALKMKMRARSYELLEPSWVRLGTLLLEIFEEVTRSETADVMQTEVDIKVGFKEEKMVLEVDTAGNNMCSTNDPEVNSCANTESVPSPSKHIKNNEIAISTTTLESSLITAMSDNDTLDSANYSGDIAQVHPSRRKSRRHEERLREEHAAAVKKAREEDLVYRLNFFLPEVLNEKSKGMSAEADLIQWPLPLNVKLVGSEFRISDANDITLLSTPSFVLASCTEKVNLCSSQVPFREQIASTMASSLNCVTRSQVATFIDDAKNWSSRGVMDWMRCFLNQCGQWSHLRLERDGEDIYQVCLWLERALNGELDVAKGTLQMQASVIAIADHSASHSSRYRGNGLGLSARLFLLELHFDRLLRQRVCGKKGRKVRRLVESLLGQAQKLLFEFGWLENPEDPLSSPTEKEFLRLLWFMARMYERCGNPQMAQQFYMKCRDKQFDSEERKENSHAATRVELPNSKVGNVITLAILEEKISGLRFSDVCFEARRLFDEGNHDQVIAALLDHFFPSAQYSRMTDFLHEFGIEPVSNSTQSGAKKKLIELLLESIKESLKFTEEDRVLFLLTIFYSVIEFLDEKANTEERRVIDDPEEDLCFNALAAIDFVLRQLTSDSCESIRNRHHWLLLCGLCVKCLKPSIILRFRSPIDLLKITCRVLDMEVFSSEDDITDRMFKVKAFSNLLYDIRLRNDKEYKKLSSLVPHSSKKKQTRRDRIRVVLVETLRVINRAFQSNNKLVLSISRIERTALMTLCGTLMKEEEETMARSDVRISKQLFGNGAILFLLLFESFCEPDPTKFPNDLVDLIHLLHDRLGQHGICSLSYLIDTGSVGDTCSRSCFLESCTAILSRHTPQNADVQMKLESRSAVESNLEEVDDQKVEQEAKLRFQMEICQCYRCLYDVQILPGCEDHKSGTTFASLQSAAIPFKHEDALRLACFSVPIMLASKPKNNGQKKERLKLLYALRNALADSNFAALAAQPATSYPLLEAYLAPRGLLTDVVSPPIPIETANSKSKILDESCLTHLWYLLGANYILGRVKRRGSLGELTEMEQHVRERVGFLVNDVLYFHPDRIDSWIRLGKTMKELYHAATDAFAAVLGRQRRIKAFLWYTSKILDTDATRLSGGITEDHSDISFQSLKTSWDLFKKMKEWQDQHSDEIENDKKTLFSAQGISQVVLGDESESSTFTIEEFAMTYIMRVIEFAKRCFERAAHLADEAARKNKEKNYAQHGESARDSEFDESNDDEELRSLESVMVECNEECGMLLYNLIQEFSLIKEMDLALFPRSAYLRLVLMALAYFRRSFAICELNKNAYETHFRLLYMVGKTLKKKRWCELHSQNLSEAYATAEEMANCFVKAEDARQKGDREHALVHAFYALQALRIDLTISDSPSVSALCLACRLFYEEGENEDVGVDNLVSSQKTTELTSLSEGFDVNIIGDLTHANSRRRDEILALLSDTECDDSVREVNVTLVRGWLALNIIEALESIPNEDRYFHPSRYVLARMVYWLSTLYSTLEQSGCKSDEMSTLLAAIQARRRTEKVVGPSDAAARALKVMAPIFDKKRPQVVAIWISEYIPTAKKFEELNQRQMKYDYYRLKYWRFYIALLVENAAYGRLKEVGSWVLTCKEEHDVIDLMLAIVMEARGKLLRGRLRELITADNTIDTTIATDRHLKLLAKAYTFYLELLTHEQRLARVANNCELIKLAELLMVAVFFISAANQHLKMEKPAEFMDQHFNGNVTVIIDALLHNDIPPRVYDAQNRDAWTTYLDAAHLFCEENWPERSSKGKPSKRHSRIKATAPLSTASPFVGATSNLSVYMDPSQTPQSLAKQLL
ncbi:calcineurin-binding protein cabin-1-like [Plasmopara halstedii]|uniref:Calcineurin-binding protein cabin-1-like n=1 Tax=Plasmopara halstedii TaxID=4781 RepID=A0A0P1AUU1_PLAHL|nr:calcineurin-binding protein cabin-1-like [Plasmopara halstedii]CEG45164.1 calcineurin-binding protein cabin-1-like [Plasmopara halstedii]|eukprot:XP_024581533.1 calcineurin-binding protein cabin-1-like [Plasmopara halstedii]